MREIVLSINNGIVSICQLLAIIVIFIGIVKAMIIFVQDSLLGSESHSAIQESRMELGHSFSLGLGFLIGASILNTTLAPTWSDIGKLAAIILIRTTLNYFLLVDLGKIRQKKRIQKKRFSKSQPKKES